MVHETIASQIDNMRPPHLVPGKHIGIEPVDRLSIMVTVVPTGVTAMVRLDEGRDLYDVAVCKHGGEATAYEGVFCDQLGDLIFGVNAEPWTLPFGGIQILDADGNVVEEHTF